MHHENTTNQSVWTLVAVLRPRGMAARLRGVWVEASRRAASRCTNNRYITNNGRLLRLQLTQRRRLKRHAARRRGNPGVDTQRGQLLGEAQQRKSNRGLVPS